VRPARLDESGEGARTPRGNGGTTSLIQNRHGAGYGIHPLVRTFARQELPEYDAEAVHVRRLGVEFVGENFGSHPLHSTAVSGHDRLVRRFQSAQSEIGHLGSVALVQEDVGALQVTMEDRGLALVQVGHAAGRPAGHFLHEHPGPVAREFRSEGKEDELTRCPWAALAQISLHAIPGASGERGGGHPRIGRGSGENVGGRPIGSRGQPIR